MKSSIKIDFAGVEDSANQFKPVIKVQLVESDDTRDKLLKSFFESLEHQSQWLYVRQNEIVYEPNSIKVNQYLIEPIKPSDFENVAKTMQSRMLLLDVKSENLNVEGYSNTEPETLTSLFKIGDNVTLDFLQSGKIKNCTVQSVKFIEDTVNYNILISTNDGKGSEQIHTLIENVESMFVTG